MSHSLGSGFPSARIEGGSGNRGKSQTKKQGGKERRMQDVHRGPNTKLTFKQLWEKQLRDRGGQGQEPGHAS